jgi:hypothetical protein
MYVWYERREGVRMKRRQSNTIFAWTFVLFVMLGSIYQVIYSESNQFHFDTVYPKNLCTKATEQCVNVWGAWDRLLHAKSVSYVHFTRTIDRSIGQLVLAQRFLVAMPKNEKKPLPEQIHYLSRVIGTVADRFEKLPPMDRDRSACLKECIAEIRKLVEQKIEQ